MSIKVMAMVFDRHAEGGGERLLALALADFARDDGSHIWLSLAELMRKTGQSRSTVQRQLARMLAVGWLEHEPCRAAQGHANVYRICPAWIAGGQARA